jgi:hypothetical protein
MASQSHSDILFHKRSNVLLQSAHQYLSNRELYLFNSRLPSPDDQSRLPHEPVSQPDKKAHSLIGEVFAGLNCLALHVISLDTLNNLV